jgi:L-histidine N-alpha-methyltransferase
MPAIESLERLQPTADDVATMAAEVRASLTARPLRWLPSKYFYDSRGSALFDTITRLPEYYLTRTEEAILPEVVAAAARRIPARHLLELGSGASRKVRRLITALSEAGALRSVTLLDVSETALAAAVAELSAAYPRLEVKGVVGDFLRDLPPPPPRGPRLVAFLGSTIGNLVPADAVAFLRRVRGALAPGDGFLLGVDLVKDPARLEAAYNDSRGVTAAFNRNILKVVNDRLGADFDPEAFEHVAFYDPTNSWIEMRLRARRAMRVHVPASTLDLSLRRGEEIRTEISAKYTRPAVESMLSDAGLRLVGWWTDPETLFAEALIVTDGGSAGDV